MAKNMSQKAKSPVVVFIAVVLIVIGYVGFKFYSATRTGTQERGSIPVVANNLNSVNVSQGSSAAASSVSLVGAAQQTVSKPGMAKAELNVVDRWRVERGYFNMLENDDYKQYDEQTLKKLADAGDVRAMQLLADLLFSRSNFKDAVALYKKAVVYGSTSSLQFLLEQEGRRSLIDESNNMNQAPEVKMKRVLAGLAYAKVAEMRGDTDVYFRSLIAPTLANPGQIPLTDEDYAKVQPLAQQIYDDLQKQRSELGLGEFDNSVPSEVVDLFKRIDPRIFNGIKAKY